MKKILISFFLLTNLILISCDSEKINIIENINHETHIPIAKNYYAMEEKDDSVIIESREDRIFRDIPTPVGDITIDDSMFLTQINNIYRKIDEYADKIITVEGMFGHYKEWDGSFESFMVYRDGPNDHNNDIIGGFFLDNLKNENISIDDWIQVVGKPYIERKIDKDGVEHKYLFLQVRNIDILPENKRGNEFVLN